jgi:hypothetical protein
MKMVGSLWYPGKNFSVQGQDKFYIQKLTSKNHPYCIRTKAVHLKTLNLGTGA